MEAGQQIGAYILEERIGEGSVAEVWRAHRHQYLDNTVAIKAIRQHASQGSDFHNRFLEEAKVMAKLEHPHIVPVHDFFFLDGIPYLVMTYIEGGSLADLLAKRGCLPLNEALVISREILDALNFAHRRGVIHRDVKPSNILVRPDGHVCLVDFGIALVVGKRRHTRFGTNIGTPEYMSPEQIQAKEIDHRTDVYSFGCVLYEMLTGRPPFGSREEGKSEYDIMNDHVHKPPPSLRALNPEVDEHTAAVVLRSLAKDPDQRYGGCQELAEELDGHYPPPPPCSFFKRMYHFFKRAYIVIPLLVSILVLVFLLWPYIEKKILEKKILQKINTGELVLPVGYSAYDIWQRYIKDKKNRSILTPESEAQVFLKLRDRGEQFFQHWYDAFAATDEEWLEVSRTYAWAVYLQAAQKNGKANIDITLEQLCPRMNEDIKRLCSRYSYSIGQIDSRKGRLKEAEDSYYSALFYDKDMCLSHVGIGDKYVMEGKFGNAEEPFNRAINCDKNLCYGYLKLGNLLQTRNRQESAIKLYKNAIQCSPENAFFVYVLAKVYENKNQYCDAIGLYRNLYDILKKSENSDYRSQLDYIEGYISSREKQYACN